MGKIARLSIWIVCGVVLLFVWAISGQIGRYVGRQVASPVVDYYKTDRVEAMLPELMKEAEKEIRKKLPIKVDEQTTIVEVSIRGSTLIYHHVLNLAAKELDLNEVMPRMNKQIKNVACNQKSMRWAMENGVSYTYSYKDKYNKFITEFNVHISDC